MLLRVAQVKCHNCGRTCGEVKAPSVLELTIREAYVPKYAAGCGLSEGLHLRCRRCGGPVYMDDPFTARPGELLEPEVPLASSDLGA